MAVKYRMCDSAGLFVRWISKTEAKQLERGGFIKNVSRWVHGKGKQDPIFQQIEGMWRDAKDDKCALGFKEMLANVGLRGSMGFIRATQRKVEEWNKIGTPHWRFAPCAIAPNEILPSMMEVLGEEVCPDSGQESL